MRAFVLVRQFVLTNKELAAKLAKLEGRPLAYFINQYGIREKSETILLGKLFEKEKIIPVGDQSGQEILAQNKKNRQD